jgi:hypothetical protein
MWGTVVDRNGVVVAIAYTGERLGDQWPGSRIISAQKANAANSLSLDTFALSTANLYSAVQPGDAVWARGHESRQPDKLMARGVPKEFVAIATEKVSAINEAYGQIARNGGFSPSTGDTLFPIESGEAGVFVGGRGREVRELEDVPRHASALRRHVSGLGYTHPSQINLRPVRDRHCSSWVDVLWLIRLRPQIEQVLRNGRAHSQAASGVDFCTRVRRGADSLRECRRILLVTSPRSAD